jgi:hypothetical protein|tara:strand:+ start:1279 stop:1587 length:309 start_codon:yes stop_codon:yes gene_type:complete
LILPGQDAFATTQFPPHIGKTNSTNKDKPMSRPPLKDAVEHCRAEVMAASGVVGIAAGISRTHPERHCIHVYVSCPGWPTGVPHTVDGYDVELIPGKGFTAF